MRFMDEIKPEANMEATTAEPTDSPEQAVPISKDGVDVDQWDIEVSANFFVKLKDGRGFEMPLSFVIPGALHPEFSDLALIRLGEICETIQQTLGMKLTMLLPQGISKNRAGMGTDGSLFLTDLPRIPKNVETV
jgi:hypothetical protein